MPGPHSLEAVDLFSLDVLPPKCSISVEAVADGNELRMRFRVERPAERLFRRREQSDWSGWFRYHGEPVALTWAAFWDDP